MKRERERREGTSNGSIRWSYPQWQYTIVNAFNYIYAAVTQILQNTAAREPKEYLVLLDHEKR
jgi:hypothetical protein